VERKTTVEYVMHPIGVIHSPFTEKKQTPIQPFRSQSTGQVVVDAEYAEGLQEIEGFSHIILIYAFHRSSGYELRIKPFLDKNLRGLFATRYPCRPNPIGMSTVRLVSRKGNELEIEGVDVLDGTPLLDIKPYVPGFDVKELGSDARTGWYANRSVRD
jgi:tRNA-Thr(GGU) m(6)t(6)A37 methyltransferase TsaA